MVNATTSDGNSSDTTNQGGEMERNYKDEGSTKDEQTGDHRNGLYEIQDHTSRSTTNYKYKYPQVGKTAVDAVHESCPQMVYIMKKNCNM
jgi:hypothetical protein